MLEAFGEVIAEGGAGVVIASQSGHRLPPLSTEQNHALATTPVEDAAQAADAATRPGGGLAARLSAFKAREFAAGNVGGCALGRRGARVNTISPGIIMTPLAKDELTGPRGAGYRRMIEGCPAKRAGTPG